MKLNETMCSFPTARAFFPVKYLDIPLTVSRLRKIDFQYLLDKAQNRMAARKGTTSPTLEDLSLQRLCFPLS
jgi:hypothetical protein